MRSSHQLTISFYGFGYGWSFQVVPAVDDPAVQDVSLARASGPAIPARCPRDFVFDSGTEIRLRRLWRESETTSPFRRSVRNALAFAADIRRKPMACEEDGPTASATMWTVILARAMAGCSATTANARVMPPPLISIDVCLRRVKDSRGLSPEVGVAVGCAGFTLGSSIGKSGMGAPGGAPANRCEGHRGFPAMPAHLTNGAISRSSCAPLSITATTPASSASQSWRLRQPVPSNLSIHRGDRMPIGNARDGI